MTKARELSQLGDKITIDDTTGDFSVDTDTLYVDVSADRVGIGTSSPDTQLVIANGSDTLKSNLDSDSIDIFASGKTFNLGTTSNTVLRLFANNSEVARADTAGHLLVSKSSTDVNTAGVAISSVLGVRSTVDGNVPLLLNRNTSDGDIAIFRKDGSTIGYIGTGNSGDLYIGNDDTGFMFAGGSNAILPTNQTTLADNAIDFGLSNYRYQDIYATNGTIQTSDQNEKQQIASLTDAEITAAKAISKLFKTFKWNDSVAEKGDAARTHSGVIAQEVEQAMTDAGLNAGDYAFWCSNTWWETQTEVPAVEAVDEVLDEDGNVITEAVEAQEAYTRTDTYDTAEEAPEGATERNRKGIRYPQLLSFIGAATEQRLASIESRLDALESA